MTATPSKSLIKTFITKVSSVLFPDYRLVIEAGSSLIDLVGEKLPAVHDRNTLDNQIRVAAIEINAHMLGIISIENQTSITAHKINTAFVNTVITEMIDSSDFDLKTIVDDALCKDTISNILFENISHSDLAHANQSEEMLILRMIDSLAEAIVSTVVDSNDFQKIALEALLTGQASLTKMVRANGKEVNTLFQRVDKLFNRLLEKLESPEYYRVDAVERIESLYIASLSKQYSNVTIIGVDYATSISFDVEDIHVELQAIDYSQHDTSFCSVIDFVNKNNYCCILGNAGSGKTTLLQFLTAQTICESQTHPGKGLVPFVIRLRDHPADRLPSRQLFYEFSGLLPESLPLTFVEDIFASNRAIVLIDGVDELENDDLNYFSNWLESQVLLSPAPKQVIITSRPNRTIVELLEDKSISYATISDMNPRQVADLCSKWFSAIKLTDRNANDNYCKTAVERILNLRQSRRNIRDLTRTPLFCSMICALYYHRQGYLPSSTSDLYRSVIDLLIDRRDSQKRVKALGATIEPSARSSVAQQLSYNLAYSGRITFQSDDFIDVAVPILERHSISHNLTSNDYTENSRSLLRYLTARANILEEVTLDNYTFRHKSFLEFLCAQYTASEALDETLIHNLYNETWRSVALHFVNLVGTRRANKLVSSILNNEHDEIKIDTPTRIIFCLALLNAVDALSPELRTAILLRLDELIPPKDEYSERYLLELPEDLHGFVCEKLVSYVGIESISLHSIARWLGKLNSFESRDAFRRFAVTVNEATERSSLCSEYWRYSSPEICYPILRELVEGASLRLECNLYQIRFLCFFSAPGLNDITINEQIDATVLEELGSKYAIEILTISDASAVENFDWLDFFPDLRELSMSNLSSVQSFQGIEQIDWDLISLNDVPAIFNNIIVHLRHSVSNFTYSLSSGYRTRIKAKSQSDGLVGNFSFFDFEDFERWLDEPQDFERHTVKINPKWEVKDVTPSLKEIRKKQSKQFRKGRQKRQR